MIIVPVKDGESIEEDSMSFIVGAGFSRNISEKFPLWGELLSPEV